MKRVVITLAAMVVVCVSTAAAADETPADFQAAPIDGGVLKKDPDARYRIALGLAKNGAADNDTSRLGEARAKFWETYPDKKGHEEAREQFAQLLYVKDMLYLQAYLWPRILAADDREIRRKGEQDATVRMMEFLGGDAFDGGIPGAARAEFSDWAEEAVRRLGPTGRSDDIFKKSFAVGAGVLSDRFRDIFNAGGKEYQAYLSARDWAEYDMAKVIPAGFADREHYGIYVYFRYGHYGYEDAKKVYEGFAGVMGKKAAEDAAEAVLKAERTPSGNLVTHVPEPYKTGPGGGKVEDYDIAYPPGVIGVYSNPLVAMEMQATEGNDQAYAIYLLSRRFVVNNYFTPQQRQASGKNKWTWAASQYRAVESAFGKEAVASAAQAVHTAKRRLITGSIMNQEALGAKRNDPVECLEDILARKDPAGYLKLAVAMKQNPMDPGSVDIAAAYQAVIAQNNEKDLLGAATRMANDKPHFAYARELDAIIASIGQPQTVKAAGPMIDFPSYQDWARFAPGTQVAYVQRTWLAGRGDYNAVTPRGWPDLKFMYTLKSVTPERADLWHTEQAFDWQNGAAHPPRDTEIAYPAKIEAPDDAAKARAAAAEKYKFARIARGGGKASEPVVETGEETLAVGGRGIKCKWKSELAVGDTQAILVKTWTSDEVPTGLVRKLEDQVYAGDRGHPPSRSVGETYLESFKGFAPGDAAAAADAQQKLPPPGPLAPALAAKLPQPRTAPAPVAHSNFDPNMRTPASAPAQVPASSRQRAAAVPPQADDARTAMMTRYRTVIARAGRDVSQLTQKQRTPGGAELPAEVKEARDGLRAKMRDVMQAVSSQDGDKAGEEMDSLEESLKVIEDYLK